MSKIEIPKNSKIRITWSDKPENYNRETKNKIRHDFAKKYGVDKNNINVIHVPIKVNDKGEIIEISGASLESIMDINYQRQLMKEWLDRENKTVDFDRLMKLDDKVNNALDVDLDKKVHRSWKLRWITMNNFLCYGDNNNFISFSNLDGLNIVSSEPRNQGGKTTFSVDALKFLFFGRTTKTEKNEQIFNSFSDKNELVVRGMIEFDGAEIIIERKMTRTAKKDGGWTVKNYLNYYEILPDGEEKLMNDEDAKVSTLAIQNTIGSEKDFDTTILATGNNLESLIDSTPTESGKLITKFIGLEIVEMKEKTAREMYNDFGKTKLSNLYDSPTLINEILEAKETIESYEGILAMQNSNLTNVTNEINTLKEDKDKFYNSKLPVDVYISQLNPKTLEDNVVDITERGKNQNTLIANLNTKIEELKSYNYNENEYHDLVFNSSKIRGTIDSKTVEVVTLEGLIKNLVEGEFCPTCKRSLEDVDHTNEINENQGKVDKLKNEIEILRRQLDETIKKIDDIKKIKDLVDSRHKLEIEKDKADVDLLHLKNEYKEKKSSLDKYNLNKESINTNIDIDNQITKISTDITVKENERDELVRKISNIENTINNNKQKVVTNEELVRKLNAELEVDKIFKLYIDMIGKKGISKLVLRSVLPIINSELYRLMDDVCDFNIELIINTKNEVEYLLEKDGVTKLLKSGSGFERTISSLALRCVLGKMSHLPMPNFITFDEIFGKVADTNIEAMRPMFEKIKDMFDIVFLITHNDLVKDWGDNTIHIVKTDNISTIRVN